MKYNFYQSTFSASGSRGTGLAARNLFILIITFVVGGAWLSPARGQSAFGSVTGTKDDTYVINNDNTNVWTSMRLQNSDNRGWNMINKGNYIYWSLAQNATYQDPGINYMQLTALPTPLLTVNGNIQLSNALVPMGLITELPATTSPLLNMSVNFREADRNNDYRGAGFRIDSRNDAPLFQWVKRSAGQAAEQIVMTLHENGNLYLGEGALAVGIQNQGMGPAPATKGKLHVVGDLHVENLQGKQTFHVSKDDQLVFVGDSAIIQYQASTAGSPIRKNDFSLWVSRGIVSEDFAIANATDWADFVFDTNYALDPLAKVEAYINQHGHLPEMPTEEEVKAKGYSMHDINRKLLQKIEELTLHAIEQEKKMELLMQQTSRMDELANRLSKLENSK